MIQLKKMVFNSFQVNTYIIYDETGECIIVDPANYEPVEDQALSAFISEHNLVPVLNINTHCHIDHILGINHVKQAFNVPFRAHENEEKLLSNAPLMGKVFGFNVGHLPAIDHFIGHGEVIAFGNSELRAIHVPGHSAGSLAFYAPGGEFAITGDALFAGSIGRTDLPGGDYDTLIASISSNLFSLPPATTIWPGHGESSTIGDEIANNTFFK
ncbi:MAG: MBL fold metallo-hydrolase [Bacteroidales bacterium]|nr:MBL fold metallo-hydrolase [Bacteroidales bacterium]MDT8430819.1 MBL fold metallo-hydrolase [Bacteroidales bacterium]